MRMKIEIWEGAPKKIQKIAMSKTRSKISISEARSILYLIADSIDMPIKVLFEQIYKKG